MNVEKYKEDIRNLKFGQVPFCDTENCEICGVKLGRYISPSNPMFIKDGQRVCAEDYFNNKTLCQPVAPTK